VLSEFAKDLRSHRYFKVRCDCGEEWIHRIDFLTEIRDGRECRRCEKNGDLQRKAEL
jgi:hypothetical protein